DRDGSASRALGPTPRAEAHRGIGGRGRGRARPVRPSGSTRGTEGRRPQPCRGGRPAGTPPRGGSMRSDFRRRGRLISGGARSLPRTDVPEGGRPRRPAAPRALPSPSARGWGGTAGGFGTGGADGSGRGSENGSGSGSAGPWRASPHVWQWRASFLLKDPQFGHGWSFGMGLLRADDRGHVEPPVLEDERRESGLVVRAAHIGHADSPLHRDVRGRIQPECPE